jgi:hypothetical protein
LVITAAAVITKQRQKALYFKGFFSFKHFVLATAYFPPKSIIGSTRLNFSVRNGKRCDPCDKSPTQKVQIYLCSIYFLCVFLFDPILLGFVVCKFPNRNRNISTSQLNRLLCLHLKPINVIISHGSKRFLILKLASLLDAFRGYPFPT